MGLFGKKTEMVVTVPEMSCPHCELKVNNALSALAGVSAVKADAKSKHVTITCKADAVSLETVAAALAEVGYTVSN
jgi:copper chaperone